MSDPRINVPPHTPPHSPPPKSNGTIIFIVGGLVVAVAVLAYIFADGSAPSPVTPVGNAPSVTIENNAPAAPAPAEPAPAPAEPAPAPAPAPAPTTPPNP